MKCDEIDIKYFEYISPSIRHRSVKDEYSIRSIMAKKQLEKYNKLIQNGYKKEMLLQKTVDLVIEILGKIGIHLPDTYNCIINVQNNDINYREICKDINLENREDIVWIKLNLNGCISVIGTSRDICFNEKTKTTTTSGKINAIVGQEWDNTKVLIFPLADIPEGLNRSDVESIIGNYLIAHDIPILDFYSHTY